MMPHREDMFLLLGSLGLTVLFIKLPWTKVAADQVMQIFLRKTLRLLITKDSHFNRHYTTQFNP